MNTRIPTIDDTGTGADTLVAILLAVFLVVSLVSILLLMFALREIKKLETKLDGKMLKKEAVSNLLIASYLDREYRDYVTEYVEGRMSLESLERLVKEDAEERLS